MNGAITHCFIFIVHFVDSDGAIFVSLSFHYFFEGSAVVKYKRIIVMNRACNKLPSLEICAKTLL